MMIVKLQYPLFAGAGADAPCLIYTQSRAYSAEVPHGTLPEPIRGEVLKRRRLFAKARLEGGALVFGAIVPDQLW